jgi:hypothetical protein
MQFNLNKNLTTSLFVIEFAPAVGRYISTYCIGAKFAKTKRAVLEGIAAQMPNYSQQARQCKDGQFRACIERLRKTDGGAYRLIGSSPKGYFWISSNSEMVTLLKRLRNRVANQNTTISYLLEAQYAHFGKRYYPAPPEFTEEEATGKLRQLYKALANGGDIRNVFDSLTNQEITARQALGSISGLIHKFLG